MSSLPDPQDGTLALVAAETLRQGRARGLHIEAWRHPYSHRVHLRPLPVRAVACGLRLVSAIEWEPLEEDETVWPICESCWRIVTGAAP